MAVSPSHIYISPHLDDAVCSCGGLIYRQTHGGERVQVVTLFTAGIENPDALSPTLRTLHRLWGFLESDPYPARRAEDIAALEILGADYRHIGWPGALYRRSRSGRFLYTGLSYFGSPPYEDLRLLVNIRRLLQDLRQQHPDAVFHIPLGVGGHVDHRLVRRAARDLPGPVHFYEEIPYVLLGKVAPLVMRLLSILSQRSTRLNTMSSGGHVGSLISAIQSRTSLLGGPQLALLANRPSRGRKWQPTLHPIDLQAKFEAVMCYATQIPMLFGTLEQARRALETYATSIRRHDRTPYERQWVLQPR